MSSFLKKSILLFGLLFVLLLSACGGGRPPVTELETKLQAESKTESITETETETEKETKASRVEPGERENDPSGEELLAWADSLYNDAVQKLADAGDIPALGDTDETKLAFGTNGSGSYTVQFLNGMTGDRLTGKVDTTPEMVIAATPDKVYCSVYRQRVDQTVPFFFPSNTKAGLLHSGENTEVYADTVEECQYLIYTRPFISHVDEGFYSGGWDRTLVTTVVFIIDAKTREIAHIEAIGTDVPGASVSMGANKGKPKWEEAEEYILGLLEEES